MSPDEFCRWLQGFAELNEAKPTDAQWKSIREHLQTVFVKVTPPVASSSERLKPDEKKVRELLEGLPRCSHDQKIC